MTDITEHNAQVVVYGEVASAGEDPVEVVVPRVGTLEGAIAVCGATTNAVAVKTSVSTNTLTITPASTVGTDDVYRIVAWGY